MTNPFPYEYTNHTTTTPTSKIFILHPLLTLRDASPALVAPSPPAGVADVVPVGSTDKTVTFNVVVAFCLVGVVVMVTVGIVNGADGDVVDVMKVVGIGCRELEGCPIGVMIMESSASVAVAVAGLLVLVVGSGLGSRGGEGGGGEEGGGEEGGGEEGGG